MFPVPFTFEWRKVPANFPDSLFPEQQIGPGFCRQKKEDAEATTTISAVTRYAGGATVNYEGVFLSRPIQPYNPGGSSF